MDDKSSSALLLVMIMSDLYDDIRAPDTNRLSMTAHSSTHSPVRGMPHHGPNITKVRARGKVIAKDKRWQSVRFAPHDGPSA